MKVESTTQQGSRQQWTNKFGAMLTSLALAGSLGCGNPNSENSMISLHCSPPHNRPLPAIGKIPRHLDVKIYPTTDSLRRSDALTVVVTGYRLTVSPYTKEVVQIHNQNPNATRIAHLPTTLSVELGDRVEVSLGDLTLDQIKARQGIYVGFVRITAVTMSCS